MMNIKWVLISFSASASFHCIVFCETKKFTGILEGKILIWFIIIMFSLENMNEIPGRPIETNKTKQWKISQ